MNVRVNGQPLDVSNGINIDVDVDPNGESLPNVNITAQGGRLEVYHSRVKQSGNIRLHYFGSAGQLVTMDL